MRVIFVFVLWTALVLPIQAAIEVMPFSNPAQEQLYQQLTQELRCLVCQNETLAASNAALARDLRQQIYKMIKQGQSHDQIEAYMTQRYGDFVLYRPPLKLRTVLLWFGPVLLLIVGVIVFFRSLKQKREETFTSVDEMDRVQLATILMRGEKQ